MEGPFRVGRPVPGGALRAHPGERTSRPACLPPWLRDPGRVGNRRVCSCWTAKPAMRDHDHTLRGPSLLTRQPQGGCQSERQQLAQARCGMSGAGGGQGPPHGVEGRGPCSWPPSPRGGTAGAPDVSVQSCKGCSSLLDLLWNHSPVLPQAHSLPRSTSPWRGLLTLHVGLPGAVRDAGPTPSLFQRGRPCLLETLLPSNPPSRDSGRSQPKPAVIMKLLSTALGQARVMLAARRDCPGVGLGGGVMPWVPMDPGPPRRLPSALRGRP